MNFRLAAALTVVLGRQGLFLSRGFETCVQRPIFLRNKSVNLRLSVTDDAQRHRLHPAPKYITIRGKGDVLAALRREVKKADKIYLATAPNL
mgnify:CR=1 FL=1